MTRNDRSSTVVARSKESIDKLAHTYRLQCEECDGFRFAELGGELKAAVEAGDTIDLACGRCEAETPHRDVTGGGD